MVEGYMFLRINYFAEPNKLAQAQGINWLKDEPAGRRVYRHRA